MKASDIRKIKDHLKAALALLEKLEQPTVNHRNEWRLKTGELSVKGTEHLHSLFAKGKSSHAIAKEMGLSYRLVSKRHDHWRKKNPSPAAWLRQDGR